MAFFYLASTNCDNLSLLRLFLCRVGDDDAAFCCLFLFEPAYEDAVM